MSLLDEYKKKYPQQSNSLEDYKKVYKTPAPYTPSPDPVVPPPVVEPKKPGILDRIESFTARPEEGSARAQTTWGQFPSSLVENLPFGVGEIVKQSRDDPETVSKVNFEDILAGIRDTSKGTFAGIVGAGASLAGVPLKFNVPVLGEVTNLQYNAAQRIASGESSTRVILEEGIVNNIFSVLMLAGLAGEVAGPRNVTVAKSEFKGQTPSGLKVKEKPKSFRLYEEPKGTQALTPDMVNKLGVDLGPKYNPELPTYFKVTGKANGVIRGEVVQIKPSYLETFLKKFGTDISKVPDDMIIPLVSREITTKQIGEAKVSIVPETAPIVPITQKPEIINKLEQIIPEIKTNATDEHLVQTAKNLAQESGDPALITKVEEAIAQGEKIATQVEEVNKNLEQYTEAAQQTPEKELTEPMYEPYKPARTVPVDRVYQNTPTSKFIIGEFEGKPYTTDSYILEFNSDVQPPSKTIIVDGKKITTPKVEVFTKDSKATPAPSEQSIKQLIPPIENQIKVEPVKLQKTEDGKQSFVTLEGDGVNVDMQQKYYDYFNKKYPNAVFMAVETYKPVVVNSGGKMVGLIMPSDLKNTKWKLAPTWEKPKPAQPKLSDAKSEVVKKREKNAEELKKDYGPGGRFEDTPERRVENAKEQQKKHREDEQKVVDKLIKEGKIKPSQIIPDEKVTTPRSSSAGDMSKGAGKIGNFEPIEPLKEGSKPFKLHNEVLALAKKFNPNGSIMESKNMPHGAAGVRWSDTGNISTQGLNDLAIMSHELGHTIDTENGITDKLMVKTGEAKNGNPIYDPETLAERQGLTKVYTSFYAGAKDTHPLKQRMREGYATLLQKYVEMPQTITAQFPQLVKDFILPGGKFYNPTAAAMIADSHKIVADYQNLSAIDKMGARVTDTLTEVGKKSFMNPIETINYEMTDNIAPYEKLDQNLADTTRLMGYTINLIQQNIKGSWKVGTRKSDNAYWGIRDGKPVKLQDYNWNSIIHEVGKENQLKFGHWLLGRATYFDYKELASLKSQYEIAKSELIRLRESGRPATKEVLDDFKKIEDDYNNLQKVIEKDGITEKEATDAYNEGKEIYSRPAEMFDALNKEKIKLMMDVGLLSKEQGAEYLSKEGYASRKRDIYNEIMGDSDVPTFIRVGNTKVSSMIRRRGSSKAVINPLVSAIHDDIEVTKKATKQMVLNAIGELGLETTYPDLIQKVALKTQVDKETGAISYPQEKQEGIIMMRKDGSRIPFEVDKMIAQVFNEVATPNNIGAIGRTVQFFGRTFTKGTTGIISTFLFKNPIIDSITSLGQTQNNYIPVYSQIKNLQKIISNKNSPEAQYAQEYMVFVGNSHTSMGIYDLTPEQQLQWINGEVKGLEAFAKAVEDKVNLLTVPTQMTEIGTRMMEYINARMSGKTFARSLEEAGQVSAPFHHKPRFGNSNGLKLWIGNLPYARSAIQVTTQAIKTMARDKKSRQRYLLVWAAVIAAYVAAQEGSMDDATEEQKNLYEGLYGKELARGIYYPDSDGKTLNVVPVGESMGWLAAIINMELMEMAGRTDYKVADYVQAGSSFIPQQLNPFNGIGTWFSSVLPKPLDVGVGMLTNTKFYPATLPIESQSLQRLPAGMRFNEKTSPVSKWAGKEFGISPVKMDYLVTGLIGRAGNMVLGKASYWNFLSSFEKENYFTSSRTVQNFWEAKKKNDEDYAGYKKDPMANTKAENAEIVNMNNKLKGVYKYLNDYGDIDIEKYPERAQKQRELILKQLEKLNL